MLHTFLNPTVVFAAAILKMQQNGILGFNLSFSRQEGELTHEQQMIIEHMPDAMRTAKTLLDSNILDGVVSADLAAVNEWLRAKGIKKTMEGTGSANPVYVAAVYKHPLTWHTPGKENKLVAANGQTYPAVKMDATDCQVFKIRGSSEYVIVLTDYQYKAALYISTFEHMPTDETDLLDQILACQDNMIPTREFQDVYFPMLDMAPEIDMSWCADLNISDETGRVVPIGGIVVEAALKLNQYGAVATAGATFQMESLSVGFKEDLQIKRPFGVWIRWLTDELPTMYGYAHYDCWHDPGDLTK